MPKARALVYTRGRRAQLTERIKEHSADDVLAVVNWWLRSRHARADYLRENGHDVDTLLRADNFPKYLRFSKEKPQQKVVRPSFKPATVKAPTDLPPLSVYSIDAVAKAEAELADLRGTMTPATWDRALRTALKLEQGAAQCANGGHRG